MIAVVALVVVAITRRDEAIAPVPAGHIALGSALDADDVEGRDCRDAAPTGASPACTLLQTELPGRTLVVPRDGAIRAWTVRGARGELVLQVLRRRDAQIFQVVRSQPQVATADVQRFAAALPARAGDLLALAVVPGATVGVVPDVAGARTERWTDPVSADRGPGQSEGFAHEVQLQVDFEPGARLPAPRQVTGAAAAQLPAGREVAAGDVALPDGRRVRVALVEHGGAVHVDLFRDDERRARIVVPDLVPGGEVVEFKPFESAGNPSQLNVAWRNPGTRSDIFHYFGLDAEALEFYS